MIDLLDGWILFFAFSTHALSFSHLNPTVQIDKNDFIITTYKWEIFILEVILTKSSSPAIPRLLKTTHLKIETVNSIVHIVNFTKRDKHIKNWKCIKKNEPLLWISSAHKYLQTYRSWRLACVEQAFYQNGVQWGQWACQSSEICQGQIAGWEPQGLAEGGTDMSCLHSAMSSASAGPSLKLRSEKWTSEICV